MGRLMNLKGNHYGSLTVIERAENSHDGRTQWLCRCDCGAFSVVNAYNLQSGHTQSCGHCEKYELIDSNTMQCVLKNGDFFLFDRQDFPVVKMHKWSIEDSGYVHSTTGGRHIRLHQELLDVPLGLCIDHINGHRWDNRRCNLRAASNKQNCRNAKLSSRNSTGYKGVSFDKRRGKYYAVITVNYKNKFLGYFGNPLEAAFAYDEAAFLYFGEFARPNFRREDLNGSTEILALVQ